MSNNAAARRVFVTGATGVLGRRVIPRLLEAGHNVTALARTEEKAAALLSQGAAPAVIDLFSADQVASAIAGHDAVMHLATNIPTGLSAAFKRGWKTNDTLRRDASALISAAAIDASVGRYIGESLTFPYHDSGNEWIDESVGRDYFWGSETVLDAERSAANVASSGGVGVSLRFSMFDAADSAHFGSIVLAAKRGVFALTGAPESILSMISADDAASAVVAALEAPSGVYNISESDPQSRHALANVLALAVGRTRLRLLPKIAVTLGGSGLESISRSQRISSALFSETTGWEPVRSPINDWKELT